MNDTLISPSLMINSSADGCYLQMQIDRLSSSEETFRGANEGLFLQTEGVKPSLSPAKGAAVIICSCSVTNAALMSVNTWNFHIGTVAKSIQNAFSARHSSWYTADKGI